MSAFAGGVPSGTHDRLPAENAARQAIDTALRRLFEGFGYGELRTPAIEYYSTFLRADVPLAEEEMFKMTGGDGRLVVLRPDSTTPAARVYATKLWQSGSVCRLYYLQNVFSMAPQLRGLTAETAQAGVELIGAGGQRTDIEMLVLAIRALSQLCGARCHVEIGHAGLFLELLRELDGGARLDEQIRLLIERKNYAALGDALAPYRDNPAASALLKLVKLFGGAEVLGAARDIALTDEARRSIEYLEQLYNTLRDAGLDGHVTFDLGLVQRIDYYTGIVFQGYAEGAGEPVLRGGRYDRLVEHFGAPAPAIGWALDTDSIVRIGERSTPTAIVWYGDRDLNCALDYVGQHDGCELSPFDTFVETLDYAAKIGIAEVVRIDGGALERVTL